MHHAARQRFLTEHLSGVPFCPTMTRALPGESAAAPAAARGVEASRTGDAREGARADMRVRAGEAPRSGSAAQPAPADKAALLDELRREHDLHCPHCTTAAGHTNTVFGEGAPDARIMFIGEAPGAEEDRTGRPFVGRAGQKLDDMIRAMGLKREDVYIANILKSRPPNNRTPRPDEIVDCSPFLARQIAIIQPEALVALGNPATKFLLQTDQGITRMRGQWSTHRSPDGLEIPVMPTFHPAYLLRNYTREVRERVWSDLQAVMTRLGI